MSLIVSFLSPSTHHIPLTVIYFLFCGAQLQNYLYVYFYLGSQNDANGQYKNNLHYCICYFSLSRSNGKQQVTAEQPKIQTKFVLDCVVLIYTQQLVVF